MSGRSLKVSQVFGGKARMSCYPNQHLRADLFSVVKCEDIIRPGGTGKDTMGSAVRLLDCPADAESGSEDMLCSC